MEPGHAQRPQFVGKFAHFLLEHFSGLQHRSLIRVFNGRKANHLAGHRLAPV